MTETPKAVYETLKVLVVEDDEFQRGMIIQALQVLGCGSLREAGDGETALKACMAGLPDLIICDINMQPMDGLAFLGALKRAKSKEVREIPLIFLTSHHDKSTVEAAIKAGVSAFLVKPPTLKALKEKIDLVLSA